MSVKMGKARVTTVMELILSPPIMCMSGILEKQLHKTTGYKMAATGGRVVAQVGAALHLEI